MTAQIDATRANADAQAKATKQAADAQQAALMQQAQASATQQAQMAARAVAEGKAADAAGRVLPTADVQLDSNPTDSVAATRQRRKASFGQNYTGGVSI